MVFIVFVNYIVNSDYIVGVSVEGLFGLVGKYECWLVIKNEVDFLFKFD